MKKSRALSVVALLLGAAAITKADGGRQPLVVTASNADKNQLLVYDTAGHLLQTLPTLGKGGASGNAGGVAAWDGQVAVVNFGSKSVSTFERGFTGLRLKYAIPVGSNPVSVAFGHDHLYVLGTTAVESHRLYGRSVSPFPDGVVPLLKADGSAAQVGVLPDSLIISEKSNVIETVALRDDGGVTGVATLVQNIPGNVDAPFGLITRGNNAYVSIAHSDEISLVRNGTVLTVTSSGSEHAPCWLSLIGPFLYSSNTASKTISRFAVYGQKIVQDQAVAAQLGGGPSDSDSLRNLLAMVDANGSISHLSTFNVDEDGNLTLKGSATINAPANGVAIVHDDQKY